MKFKNTPLKFFAFVLMLSCFQHVSAQNNAITVYQYRHVPEDKIDEFVKRETTYWIKVAKKAVDDKKLTFWALLEKVGGYDLPNSSNFLFINTYTDIDKAGDVWNNVEATAGVKIAQMETGSMSTTTSMFFLHNEDWAQAAKAVPANDFGYVDIVYHNTNYPDSLISLEKTYWHPYIQKAMDSHQTAQLAWGNASVLSPSGDNIKFTTISFDLYKTLADALMPHLATGAGFPVEGLTKIGNLEISRRGSAIYRIVKVVSAN
jgi:hypothetical protein